MSPHTGNCTFLTNIDFRALHQMTPFTHPLFHTLHFCNTYPLRIHPQLGIKPFNKPLNTSRRRIFSSLMPSARPKYQPSTDFEPS